MAPGRIAQLLLAAAMAMPSAFAMADELGSSEIAQELVGKQIVWWEDAGWRHGHLFLLPGGVAEMTIDRPQADRDVGQWTMRGDQLCTRWGEMRDGLEKCYHVRRGETGQFVTTGGNVFEIRELGV